MAIFRPVPIFHDRYRGTPPRMEKSARLEKVSLPAPSAGRGPFLMDGY
jgi:hypothetical protein